MECSVCFEEPVDPVKLPCGHIFCYLCIKGVHLTSSRSCPLCRQPIPHDFIIHPKLVNPKKISAKAFEDGQSWYYEGKSGWWVYDSRTSEELETHFKNGDTLCEILIAGHIYVIDFNLLVQYRKDCSGKKRKIKRDQSGTAKGVGGIKFQASRRRSVSRRRAKRGRNRSAEPYFWSVDGEAMALNANSSTASSASGNSPIKRRRTSWPDISLTVPEVVTVDDGHSMRNEVGGL